MILSGPIAAKDAKCHEGLLLVVKGRSKPIRPDRSRVICIIASSLHHTYITQRMQFIMLPAVVTLVGYGYVPHWLQ